MSDDTQVSIGQVKRDISDLVNRVAYARERIVLTSRGKPKAALVSMEDYARLESMQGQGPDAWQAWQAQLDKLNADILARRQQAPVPVDEIWEATRQSPADQKAELILTLLARLLSNDPTPEELMAELRALRAVGAFDRVESLRNKYANPALAHLTDTDLNAALREAATEWEAELDELVPTEKLNNED